MRGNKYFIFVLLLLWVNSAEKNREGKKQQKDKIVRLNAQTV